MDRFQAMRVFVGVVDANSFSRAADNLGLPRATVTTIIQSLEARLQVRLLNRTTRRISLTPDGAVYYEHCIRILGEVEETEAAFRDVTHGPRGRLRVDMPAPIGRLIVIPGLRKFQERYPGIEIIIGMSDRQVDLIREAVDCVIRIGKLQDSALVARRIGSFKLVTCAAPGYLEHHGTPRNIDDLQRHVAVNYFSNQTGRTIDSEFVVDGVSRSVTMQSNVSVNDIESYVVCGQQGFGLIQPARFMVQADLESGKLVEVLPEIESVSFPIYVAYMQNRHLSPKVRVFVDWVTELFSASPLLDHL